MIIPKNDDADIPFSFRLAKTLFTLLRGWRGEYFLYNFLLKAGLLNRAGRFEYFGKNILIPLQVPETLYVSDFSLYHGLREVNFATQINRTLDDFVFIDCGAYFGQVSMRINQLCPKLKRLLPLSQIKIIAMY